MWLLRILGLLSTVLACLMEVAVRQQADGTRAAEMRAAIALLRRVSRDLAALRQAQLAMAAALQRDEDAARAAALAGATERPFTAATMTAHARVLRRGAYRAPEEMRAAGPMPAAYCLPACGAGRDPPEARRSKTGIARAAFACP